MNSINDVPAKYNYRAIELSGDNKSSIRFYEILGDHIVQYRSVDRTIPNGYIVDAVNEDTYVYVINTRDSMNTNRVISKYHLVHNGKELDISDEFGSKGNCFFLGRHSLVSSTGHDSKEVVINYSKNILRSIDFKSYFELNDTSVYIYDRLHRANGRIIMHRKDGSGMVELYDEEINTQNLIDIEPLIKEMACKDPSVNCFTLEISTDFKFLILLAYSFTENEPRILIISKMHHSDSGHCLFYLHEHGFSYWKDNNIRVFLSADPEIKIHGSDIFMSNWYEKTCHTNSPSGVLVYNVRENMVRLLVDVTLGSTNNRLLMRNPAYNKLQWLSLYVKGHWISADKHILVRIFHIFSYNLIELFFTILTGEPRTIARCVVESF